MTASQLDILRDVERLAGHGLSHQAIASELGLHRSRITNLLRLRKLPVEIAALVRSGKLSPSHGIALLATPARMQGDLAQLALRRKWSTTQLRVAVRRCAKGVPVAELDTGGDTDVAALAVQVSELLGSPVTIGRDGPAGWRLTISATDSDVLEGVLERLGWRSDS